MFALLMVLLFVEYLGIASHIPMINALHLKLALSTMMFIYILVRKDIREVVSSTQSKLFVCFILFTAVSALYAFVTARVFGVFKTQIGYLMLFVITAFLLADMRRIHLFLVVLVTFHVMIVLMNIDRLLMGERFGDMRAGYFLMDGNDLGWSLAIWLPFALYFAVATRKAIPKMLAGFAVFMLLFGIVGTGSRGAGLAVCASLIYLIVATKKKLLGLVLVAAVMAAVIILAPTGYVERMESIREYEQDSSARARIIAWKAATQMAIDHPLGVGAGNFNSMYGRFYRERFVDESIWAPGRWLSPHSIYFLVLGEYGFLGLLLLIALILVDFREIRKAGSMGSGSEEGDVALRHLTTYANSGLVAFAVGGMLLGGVNYPHIYLLSALSLAMYSACRKTTDSGILETGETGQYKQGQLPQTRMTMSELTE